MSRTTLLRTVLSTFLASGLLVCTWSPLHSQDPARGDANRDGQIDISDAVFLLNYLFASGVAPGCEPIADTNHDFKVDISDPVNLLGFLFSGGRPLDPLSPDEIARCTGGPPTVLRQGRILEVIDPSRGIDGRAEQLSNGIIRLADFMYDGLGKPRVVVFLTKGSGFATEGFVISKDLRRDTPYESETLEFPLPPGVESDDFDFVVIWCDAEPTPYGYARLGAAP